MEQPLFFVLKLADVIAMWQDGKATFVLKLADVIARWQMLWPLFMYVMADVIAKWQMELPLRVGDMLGRCYNQVGRWNSHRVYLFFMVLLVLRCYTEPHPIYVADGTCQCFYLGMDL